MMDDEKMVRLNLNIAGRTYPVKIEKSEVDEMKQIEAEANKKINEFMLKYPNYDKFDVLAMSFLTMIFDLNKKRFDKSSSILEKRFDSLAEMLDNAI